MKSIIVDTRKISRSQVSAAYKGFLKLTFRRSKNGHTALRLPAIPLLAIVPAFPYSTVSSNLSVTVRGTGALESVTLIVKVKLPLIVGVPDIAPESDESVTPFGRIPSTTDHE